MGIPQKINLGKVACFSSLKTDRQFTSFHQQSTTNSPSKNHVLHPVFAKTPSKHEVNQRQKNYCKSVPSSVDFEREHEEKPDLR
jgi:hypothetical protein